MSVSSLHRECTDKDNHFHFCAIDTHTGDCRPFDEIQLNDTCTNGFCYYRTNEEGIYAYVSV